MKRTFAIFSALFSICFICNKSHSIDYWAIHYANNEVYLARCVKQVSADEYIVAGFTGGVDYAGRMDIWILNLDASGTINWQKTYNGVDDDEDYPTSIQLTTDGGYIVAGNTWSYAATLLDTIWVMKLDSSGNIVWQKSYGGSGFSRDYPACIQQTADGGYIIAGYTTSFGVGIHDAWILKLTSSGDIIWQKTYGGIHDEHFQTIIQTSDGGYVAAGVTDSFTAYGDYQFWIVKLDGNGNVNWQKMYRESDGILKSILQTSDGGYIAVGETKTTLGLGDIWVLMLDSDGDVTWNKAIGGDGSDMAGNADVFQETSDGGYIIAGSSNSFGGDFDSWLVKLDSTGNILWEKTYGEFGANAVQQTLDGGYIMVGDNAFGSIPTFWVLKLDSNGDIPNCSIITDTNSTIRIPSVSVHDTTAIVQDTSAVITDTSITPQDTESEQSWLCCYSSDDYDCDGILNEDDNCDVDSNPLQEDTYPPQGNGIGDTCECEGNFNCDADRDVDGSDASMFKFHFGRSLAHYPCTSWDPCRGDFNCDGDVDGSDAAMFKQDFGRSSLQNPCPVCVSSGPWCSY